MSSNPILTTHFWRAMGFDDAAANMCRAEMSHAYSRDTTEWQPVYHPGDFALHAWGTEATKMHQADIDAALQQFETQRQAADALGVSQATVSRAARHWSPVWDTEVHTGGIAAFVLLSARLLPCTMTEMERAVAKFLGEMKRESNANAQHVARNLRGHLRACIVLGIICRGSDGLLHAGRGDALGDARADLEFRRNGRVAAMCPRDPRHGPTLDRYCPKCKARIRRPE